MALAWGENGFRHMTNSKRPVNAPDDLKGLKMRTMENPVHIQAYKQFGIIPTPMAFTEVFTALQQGTVDGQENPLSVISAAKFEQVQKYMTLTGHVYSPALILMSKAQWDKLSAADKSAFVGGREGGGQGQPRADRRRRAQGRGGPPVEGDDHRRERRQGQVPGDAGARRSSSSARSSARTTSTRSRTTSDAEPGRCRASLRSRPLRNAFLALERRTTAFSLAFACAMLVAAACLGAYQILARFVFQQPAEWSEVLIRFTLIWMVFMGVPSAFRQGAMVCVDLAYRKGGPMMKRALDWLIAITALILVAVIIRYGFDYAYRARFQTISGLESLSMTWAYLALPDRRDLLRPGHRRLPRRPAPARARNGAVATRQSARPFPGNRCRRRCS